MLTRRELVTGGALGAIATATTTTDSTAQPADPVSAPDTTAQDVDNNALRKIADGSADISRSLSAGFRSNSLAHGYVPKLREAYTLYWKTHGKFPEFCEVGTDVFYDLYDWHIKNGLPIPVTRLADGRMVITFMYTQLIVRVDQAPGYVGIPFDRQ